MREAGLAMHDLLIADFGGASGVRDEGLPDSATSPPPPRRFGGEDTPANISRLPASCHEEDRAR